MDVEEKLKLIEEVGEEIITRKELRQLLETKAHPTAYDGFEPSGIAHVPFGLFRAINLKKLLRAGIKFKILLADYFALINNKMGGDLEKIQTVGKYFIEVWRACGVDMDKVQVLWASKEMNSIDYWDKVLRIAKEITLKRSMRATTIMGRTQKELQSTAQLFYPSMQVTDIFHLNVDICQLGLDQRRACVLAREIGPKLGWKKPIIVSHHMIMGLQGPKKGADEDATLLASKMSKSKPASCIYIHDSYEEIKEKIRNAYCPEKVIADNPVIEYCKYLIFESFKSMEIKRPKKFGGNLEVGNFDELCKLYEKGKLHPLDLKNAVALYLNKMIKPVREHFERNKKARKLYEVVKRQEITR